MKLFKTIILGAFFNSGHADETSQAEELSVLTSGQNLEVKLDDGENTPKRQPKEQAIMIDQNWEDFDERSHLLFEQLFPQILDDPDFLANEEQIVREDEEICNLGRDPIFNKKVHCSLNEKSGKLAPKTRYNTAARKFRHLKILVLWLQKDPRFGNYCYYGCHCLPEGAHNLSGGGYGEPVDMIDRTCKSFNQCYECAKLGNGKIAGTGSQCVGEHTKYRYQLIVNNETGEKSIRCRNPPDTCQRHICECDKRMAEGLAHWEDSWDVKYHTGRNNGAWTYADNCKKKGLGRYGRPESCCGDSFPDMKPKQKGKECCAHIPWDPSNSTKQCCANGKLKNTC